MKTLQIIFAVLLLGLVSLSFSPFFSSEESADLTQDLMNASHFGTGKASVHMAGCRTFEPPVAPRVIYPTVTKNFMTRLCALEVYSSMPDARTLRFRHP